MKDIFAERARGEYFQVLSQFIESLQDTFPECEHTKEWGLWYRNVVADDGDMQADGIAKWVTAMQAPLVKGCAKYAKAVQSITGGPALVYHAMSYKDAAAADASSDTLRDLALPSKLKDARMTPEMTGIFWDYMAELNRLAFAATRKTPPKTPTHAELAADIERRKGGKASGASGSNGPVLQQGVLDLWEKLCALRGATMPTDVTATSLAAALGEACKGVVAREGVEEEPPKVGDACSKCEERGFAKIAEAFPYLSATPAPTEEEWSVLNKALAVVTMEQAIPSDMMRGIEGVASRLVQDIAEGRADLTTLNVEQIGQEVLSQVSQEDVSDFASRIDQILPAIQKMQQQS